MAASSFGSMAEAVRDIARWERHRIGLMRWHSVRGFCPPPSDVEFGGWEKRAVDLQAAADVLTKLQPHEQRVLEILADQAVPAGR